MSGSTLHPGGRFTPYGENVLGYGDSVGYYKGNRVGARGFQILGNGYRVYSPSMARFIQADVLSPFGVGGVNCYCYCNNDPVNRYDADGHASINKIFSRLLKFSKSSKKVSKAGVVVADAPLRNHYPELLSKEYDFFSRNYNVDPRRVIRSSADFAALEAGIEYKFVYTSDSHFITAPHAQKGTGRYISHAVIAELLPKAKIRSAGALTKSSMGEVFITNQSGHYRPNGERLKPPSRHLASWSYDVSEIQLH